MTTQHRFHAPLGLTLSLLTFAGCELEQELGDFDELALEELDLVERDEGGLPLPEGPAELLTTPETETTVSAAQNLALGMPTSQSSTGHGGDSSRAVDGNTDGLFWNGSVTHTDASQAEHWWQVDLVQPEPIGEVVIYNRSDCCTQLLHDFDVLVSNDGINWESFHHAGLARPETHVSIDRVARYVRVDNPEVLHMAEVEVLRTRNLAYGKPATQSGTGFGGDASRAVDGNTNGAFGAGSVSHTATDGPDQWWQVDLEEALNIGYVVLFNRSDCCADKLHDFTVRVSTDGNHWQDIEFEGVAGPRVLVPVNRELRYLRVENGDGYLHLAEVQAFEAPRIPGLSYGRGAGWIPSYGCEEGQQYDAGLCYEPCDEGYTNVLNLCYEDCDEGYTDMGLYCMDYGTAGWPSYGKHIYDRGVGTLPIPDCGPGNEYDAGLCYPECELGYNGVGPVCWLQDVTLESISNDACKLLRVPVLSDIARDEDSALTFGVGLGAAVIAAASVELGIAYGAHDEFGCYVSTCTGLSTEIEISAFTTIGNYDDYYAIPGDSVVLGAGVGVGAPIPYTPLTVGVSAGFGVVSTPQMEPVGGVLSAGVGLSMDTPLEFAVNGMQCHTDLLQTQ